eukprot:gene2427-2660_t
MSWSSGREKAEPAVDAAKAAERVKQVNAVLKKIADDEVFQEDLKLPNVQKALRHWTNQNRLPPEEALALQDDRDVVYVLQKFQMLQAVCREALLPVPLDAVLSGTQSLPLPATNPSEGDAKPATSAKASKPAAVAAAKEAVATPKKPSQTVVQAEEEEEYKMPESTKNSIYISAVLIVIMAIVAYIIRHSSS